MLRRTLLCLLIVVMYPATALADVPQPTLALSPDQTWLLIIGAIVPLVTYVINHHAPWVKEPVKSLFLVVVAAVVGAIYKLIETNGGIAWNGATAQYILTGIVGALGAHNLLWKPSGINVSLGAGSNRKKSR